MTNPHPCEKIYEFFAMTAVDLFNTRGHVDPQLFMVEVRRPMIGQLVPTKWGAIENINELLRTDDLKAEIGRITKSVLSPIGTMRRQLKKQDMQPDIVVQINEAWAVKGGYTLEQIGADDFIQPSKHPQRIEVILVSVFSLNFPNLIGMCPILENPRRAEYAAPESNALAIGRMNPHD